MGRGWRWGVGGLSFGVRETRPDQTGRCLREACMEGSRRNKLTGSGIGRFGMGLGWSWEGGVGKVLRLGGDDGGGDGQAEAVTVRVKVVRTNRTTPSC